MSKPSLKIAYSYSGGGTFPLDVDAVIDMVAEHGVGVTDDQIRAAIYADYEQWNDCSGDVEPVAHSLRIPDNAFADIRAAIAAGRQET